MKTSSYIVVLLVVAGFFLLQSSYPPQDTKKTVSSFYSAEAKQVIDNKCYGCHSVKGKSQKAKDALMWDSLPGLDKSKIVESLNDIIEQLDKNKMPPEEMVKKFPDAALLAMERATLKAWAEQKADSLLN